jgi:hypothetical protein
MATIEVKLKPFNVPNNVLVDEPARPRQEGMHEPRSIPVSELPASTLQEMASEWLFALYNKAGKPCTWHFD